MQFKSVAFNANVNVGGGASVEFVNSIFTNASGAAVNVLGNARVVLENTTLTANDVGVWASATSSVQISNSIISGNTTDDLVGVPQAALAYSLTGDASFAGFNGNINADPLFVDPLNRDYHLQPVSPAVDAGDSGSDSSLEPASAVSRINMGRYGNTAEAAVSPATLRAEVDGKLVCPAAWKEGARLVCKVQLVNDGCDAVITTRGMAAFVGNRSGTLGGMGIWGPFVRGILSNKTVSAGDCMGTPGTFTSQVLIVDPVPTGIAPTVGAAMVQIEGSYITPPL